jgi:hypothetical protein
VDKTRAWYLANNKKAPYEIRKTFVPRHDSVMAEDMAEIGMKADIVTEVDEVIKKENDWYEYLAYDIISLAFVVFNYSSSMLNVFGLEMNTCTGAAGLAWQLMMKNLTALMNCYLPNSDVNNTFIRASIKGGRVMHLMKTFKALNDRKLISFDINSLYPAAMERFAYPTGIPSAFNFDPSVRDNGNLIHDWIQKGYMFIAEFAYVTGNQRNPLHAYKTGSTSEIFDGVATSPNSLIYPQCSDEENPLIDVSTSVDIIEMLKDGYKVLWVSRALVWKHSMKIFSPLIGHLYDTRTKLKKAKNPLEGLYKILMNSSYGKFLEQIKESTFFTTEKEWTEQKNFIIHRKSGKYRQIAKLPNGQIEYASKAMFAKSGKPAYIGSFILAYSKVIANEYIRKIGIENIWYSDTDSFYTDKVDACEQSSVLGGIKNDYGDNCFIDTAMFVDYKRYYLEVVNGSKREIKAKFNGLAIPKHEHMGDQVMMITNVMEEVISLPEQRSVRNYKDMKTFFEFFVENPGQLNDMRVIQEKWVRGKECRIDSKIFKYQVDPQRRAKWVKKDDEWIWYPLGYDLEKPEYKATEPVFYEHAKETEETLVNKRFKCRQKLPFILKDGDHFSGKVSLEKLKNRLMEEKGVEVYDSIFDDVEAFFSTSDGLIVKRKNQQYYKVDCYGVSEQIREQVIIHELVFALEQQFAKIDNLKICSPEVDVKSVEKTLSELYHALKINAGVDDTLTIKPEFNLDKSSLNSKLNNLRQSKKKPIN